MGKEGLADSCVHLRITSQGSVIAGNPRMGIRSPTGLQMCKLRLWLAREVATRRSGAFGLSARRERRAAGRRPGQKAEWFGGAKKGHEGASAGEAKSAVFHGIDLSRGIDPLSLREEAITIPSLSFRQLNFGCADLPFADRRLIQSGQHLRRP